MLFFLTLLVYTVPHIMVFGAVDILTEHVRVLVPFISIAYILYHGDAQANKST